MNVFASLGIFMMGFVSIGCIYYSSSKEFKISVEGY